MTTVTARLCSRRLHRLALALLSATLLLAVVVRLRYNQPDTATLQIVGHALGSPSGTDSSLYMNMGEAAFHAPGHQIFSALFFGQHQKFIYPPSSLFLIEALNLFPSPDFTRHLLLLAGWLGTLAVSCLLFRGERGRITPAEAGSIVLLGVLFLPLAEALYRGQVQVLLTLLWGLAALAWQRERRGWAGFLLAITCAFKPQLAIFLLWGLTRRQWRFSAVFSATFTAITTVSVARFGVQNHLDYVAVLSYLSQHGEALWANQSLNGILNRVLSNGDSSAWNAHVYPPFRLSVYVISTTFTLLGVLIGLVLPWRMGWAATTADFLFFGGLSVVISPIAWEHHYGAFFFLLVFLLARAETLTRVQWGLLAASTLAMANRLPPLDHRIAGLSSLAGAYLFYAGLAVLWLLARNSAQPNTRPEPVRRVARPQEQETAVLVVAALQAPVQAIR